MNYLNTKKFAMLLVLVLVATALSGCGTKTIQVKDEQRQPTTLETIGRLEGIANALGCMFGADCSNLSKPNEKDWQELDKE